MPTSYTLTEAELGLLQKLLDDSRRRTVNSQSRYQQGQQIRFSPDVYVALVPDSGIPGLLATYPGKATCDIYYLTDLSSDERLVPYETTKVVFNLSHNPVPGCSWILVIRDKAGRWWASGNYFETTTDCDTGTGTGTGTGTEPNVSDKIWAKVTDRQNYAHSWVEAEQITTTGGVFPTVPGASFKVKSGGLSGIFNLYERNQYANIPIGAYVEIWANGDDWLCDFELDHFTGYIVSGSGPDYIVAEEASDNPRVVTAYEFNGVIDIDPDTRVQVWVYLVSGTWYYEFTYQKASVININIVDIDITNITNAIENTVYNYFNTTTHVVNRYEYICIDGYYCGWFDLCTCTWVPWYCYNDTCRQFITVPPGAIGPFDTKPDCEAVAPCTATGTSSLPTGTGTGTADDCDVGSILVSCCTNLLPCRLYMCITGCCTTLPSIPLNFVLPSNWVSDDIICGDHTLSFNVYCQGGVWFIVIVCDDVTHSIRRSGSTLSCDPVELSFNITGAIKLADCCEENITATVTETPVDCEDFLWWWCVAGTCIQSLTAPVGYTSGPYESEALCISADCEGSALDCCDPEPPTTLYATFGGALAPLGTVTLTKSGPSWSGSSSACGSRSVVFLCNESNVYVCSVSSADLFVGTTLTCDPFHWEGSSPASVAPCSGTSTMVITETPP